MASRGRWRHPMEGVHQCDDERARGLPAGTILAGLATAIDAQDIAGFLKLENPGILAAGAFCPPINKINAGPPALEPPLPLLDPNSCNGIY